MMAPKALPRFFRKSQLSSPFRFSSRRLFSSASPPPPPPPPTGARAPGNVRSRLQRLNARLPSFLRRYTTPLLGAPVTHITSFLILHELTATIPLIILFAEFHYSGWLPKLTIREQEALGENVKRISSLMKKKGWVGSDDVEIAAATSTNAGEGQGQTAPVENQQGVRLVLELATAYAIIKVLLPLRIVASVWATPWFARAFFGPIGRGVRRVVGNNKS